MPAIYLRGAELFDARLMSEAGSIPRASHQRINSRTSSRRSRRSVFVMKDCGRLSFAASEV